MAKGILLAPCGLIIERIEAEARVLVIVARAASDSAACPSRGHLSVSIHSRYQRLVSDLPSQGNCFESRFWPADSDVSRRIAVNGSSSSGLRWR
jgi:hypothetical protein